ncbi:monocarboxylate transporter 12 [Nephila pilipes]|uniref:Monocarboxylate transporter 12 n=1 Tax=Nephila pilipes TaxID=299642 RepID=A0A8X6PCJ3_NEPPI|nr:monocarboxylate transporter 12 [Nephila pilipes]
MSSLERISYVPKSDIDGGWGWIIVANTFLMRVIVDGFIFSFGIFYVEFFHYFGCTSGLASLVMSLLIGFCYLVGPIASGLVNKYGCRVTSLIGTGLASIGLLLSLIVPRAEYLLITAGIIAGTGFGLLYLPTIVSLALHFEKKRATAMGISMSGSGIGILIFAPLLEWLIYFYQYWKGAWLIATGIVLNCFVLSLFYRTFTPPEITSEPSEESSIDIHEPSTSRDTSLMRGFSEYTQTDKEGEPIRGKYTITGHIPRSTTSRTVGSIQKPDIFYTGSTENLISREISVTPSMILQDRSSIIIQKSYFMRFTDIVAQMIGLSLLKNYVFLIFSFCTIFQYLGLMIPPMYLFHMVVEIGIATTFQASLLLSILGISNTIGKIAIGLLKDITSWNDLYIYTICLLISGIATIITPVFTSYFSLTLYSFIFGFTYGGSISLSSIVLVSLLGLPRLSNSYGLFLLFTGLSASIGPPLAGVLRDTTGTYDAAFYLAGTVIALGSLVSFIIPVVQRKFPQ